VRLRQLARERAAMRRRRQARNPGYLHSRS
jgi:hypothetical protein